MPREFTVTAGSVPIAVHDHGGDGPPVVLLHGAGGNLLAWNEIGPRLAQTHRVVTLDLRGHGRSGDGPWEWDAVLDDIDAVVDQLRLDTPAVVGHSLGGMLAGQWAGRHRECPAAVSLDGHRPALTHSEHYAGMDGERLAPDLDQLRTVFDAQADMMARPMTSDQVDAMLEGQRAAATAHGADVTSWLAMVRRGLRRQDGHTFLRPGPEVTAALRDAPEFLDALPSFAEVTCPLLVVLATKDLPTLPPQFAQLMGALRAGLRRDLADLAAARANVHVREIEANHGMVAEQPEHITKLIEEFITPQL